MYITFKTIYMKYVKISEEDFIKLKKLNDTNIMFLGYEYGATSMAIREILEKQVLIDKAEEDSWDNFKTGDMK